MKHIGITHSAALLCTLLLFISSIARAQSDNQGSNSAANVKQLRSAVLFRDGVQTTCEVALIDSSGSGFVAANCLELTDNNSVKDVDIYSVAVNGGSDFNTGLYEVSFIKVHPGYHRQSMANNVAVVQFVTDETGSWANPIGVNPREFTDHIFVRRASKDETGELWVTPTTKSSPRQPDGCADASPLFAANANDYWCTALKMDSAGGGNCSIPFGTAYGSSNNTMTMAALYSHSAIYGDNFCGNSTQFHYYTLLANYTAFASGVLERPISISSGKSNPSVTHSPTYSVQIPQSYSVGGVSVVGGDKFVRLDMLAGTNTATTLTAEPFPETQKNSSALSKSDIIGLAVGVPIASVVLVAAFIFFYKWWKGRHSVEAQWEPDDVSMLQRRSVPINQMGYTGRAEDSNPTYNALQFRS